MPTNRQPSSSIGALVRGTNWKQLSIVGFIACYLLGCWGMWLTGDNPTNAAYKTLQLVLLNVSFEGATPLLWQLEVARFLLPLFTASTLVAIVVNLVDWHLTYLSLSLWPRQIVFLGAGRAARGIAKDLAGKHSILAVDKDPDQEMKRHLPEPCRMTLLKGNVTRTQLLSHLNLVRADHIYIFTGNDEQDLAIARKVITLLANFKRGWLRLLIDKVMAQPADTRTGLPRLIIDVDDKGLLRTAVQDPLIKDYKGEIIWFSSNVQRARALLYAHPPVETATGVDHHSVHIGLFGFTDTAQEVILFMVRNAAYLHGRMLKISIFGNDKKAFDEFLDRYPMLRKEGTDDPAYGGLVFPLQLGFYKITKGATPLRALREAIGAQETTSFAKIYVIEPSDHDLLDTSFRVLQALEVLERHPPVVACVNGSSFYESSEIEKLQEVYKEYYSNIQFFDMVNNLYFKEEDYPGSISDILGQMIQAAYEALPKASLEQEEFKREFMKAYPQQLRASISKWNKQAEEDRQSSRYAGDHFFVKLKELGFSLEPLEARPPYSVRLDTDDETILCELDRAIESHLEDLKRMEHMRFCIERLLSGWLCSGPHDLSSKPRKKKLHLNKTLIPYDGLDAEEQNKDEAIIRAIPLMLREESLRRYFRLKKSA